MYLCAYICACVCIYMCIGSLHYLRALQLVSFSRRSCPRDKVSIWSIGLGLKVLCAPKYFSSSFSYSTCTNDFGAVTHNERRFQFQLFNHLFRVVPGFMGKSRMNRW